jgi:ribose transport system permease protein
VSSGLSFANKAAATEAASGERADRDVRAWSLRLLRRQEAAVYLGFLLVFVYFAVSLHDKGFLTSRNFQTIVEQTTPISVMAVAAVFVLSTSEIDLSIGSVVGLSALVAASQINSHGIVIGVAAGLATGIGAGLLNGILVVALRVPSFLITLGTMVLFAGAAELVTNLQDVAILASGFTTAFGSGAFLGISTVVLWSVAALAGGHMLLRKTAYGQRVLATGDNETAARASGINTDRVRISVLTLSGASAALAGLMYVGQLQGAIHTLGANDLLIVLAAVVIGGTSLFGGRGSVVGAFVGSMMLGIISNGLILSGLSSSEQRAATGVIIVLAVAVSQRQRRSGA